MRHILHIHREIIPGPVMDFLVLSRAEAGQRAPDRPHVVISIHTPEQDPATLAETSHRLDVLRLSFHDVEEASDPPSGETLFGEEHARAVLEFVQKHRESVRLIVCHCDAGMSRSAAVAAALSRWLQEEDEAFFHHYLPNRLVYDRLLSAVNDGEDG